MLLLCYYYARPWILVWEHNIVFVQYGIDTALNRKIVSAILDKQCYSHPIFSPLKSNTKQCYSHTTPSTSEIEYQVMLLHAI